MERGIRVSTVNLSTSDPGALARFYAALLGMEIKVEEPTWVVITGEDNIPLAFEYDEHHQPPVWPSEPGKPPTQVHLEVVGDRPRGCPGACARVRWPAG